LVDINGGTTTDTTPFTLNSVVTATIVDATDYNDLIVTNLSIDNPTLIIGGPAATVTITVSLTEPSTVAIYNLIRGKVVNLLTTFSVTRPWKRNYYSLFYRSYL